MLSKLEIHNYILIDQLSIDLSNQLSVITGETGAGKSIIMGALGLILGDRADSTVCRDASKKCFIEGTFSLSNKQTYQAFFTEHELDLTDEVIIRREINAQGKSTSFYVDYPYTMQIYHEQNEDYLYVFSKDLPENTLTIWNYNSGAHILRYQCKAGYIISNTKRFEDVLMIQSYNLDIQRHSVVWINLISNTTVEVWF